MRDLASVKLEHSDPGLDIIGLLNLLPEECRQDAINGGLQIIAEGRSPNLSPIYANESLNVRIAVAIGSFRWSATNLKGDYYMALKNEYIKKK